MAQRSKSGRGNRKPELLATAQKLFFKNGYAGTTVEQVAKKAGFSKRTVYLYFKNKDELFITLADQGIQLLLEKLRALPLDDLDVAGSIESIMHAYVGFAREHPEYFRIIFQEATAQMIGNVSPDIRAQVAEHERACLSVVVQVVEKFMATGVIPQMDPWETAVIFWGTATGILLLSLGGSQTVYTRKSREELIEKATWILFQGFVNPPDELLRLNGNKAAGAHPG